MTERLAPRVAALEKGHAELRKNIQVIETDIAKINARLGATATKEDLANAKLEITGEFHRGINGILKDALAAIPPKQAARWTAVCAISSIGTVLIAIAALVVHFS